MKKWLCVLPAVFLTFFSYSQTNFRTSGAGDGTWGDPASWQVETPNGSGSWGLAGAFPTYSTAMNIEIQAPHTLIVSSNVTTDQTLISGTLIVNDGITLSLYNGTGNDLTIAVGGTLNMLGESKLRPGALAGNLVVSGSLQLGSVNSSGALVAGTTLGNIQVAGRVYSVGSKIIYGGTTGPQFIGAGNPTMPGIDVEINNTAGVTLAANVTIGNNLKISSGDLTINSTVTVRTLTVTKDVNLAGGNLVLTSGGFNANAVLNGDILGGNSILSTGINSNVTINGSGALTNSFPFATGSQYEQITINRAGENLIFQPGNNLIIKSFKLSAGTAVANTDLTLGGDLNLAAGTSLTFSGHDLTINGRFNNAVSGGFLIANSSSNLNITGAGTFGTLTFSGAGNTIKSLTLNRPTGGTLVTLNSALNITTAFTLTDGIFAHTSGLNFSPGVVMTRVSTAAMTATSVPPGGGFYDLNYQGVSMTTGVEALGNVRDITSTCTGTVTLGNDLTPTRTITISSGSLTGSSNNLTAVNVAIANGATFNAPMSTATTGLTVSGSFSNSGTFSHKSGTLIIAGNVSMSGSTINTTLFNTVIINPGAKLTPGTTLNVQGDFQNNGTFVPGTGTVVFNGSAGSKTLSGSTNTTFYDLSLNKSNVGISLSVISSPKVTDKLTLLNGQLDITPGNLVMNAGTTITRYSPASISTNSPSGGPWNLVYMQGSQTTSLELPASGNVISLTNNITSGAVTLAVGQPLIVANAFNNASATGTFSCGDNNVTVGSFANSGIFKAPTSLATTGLTVQNAFVNDGTYTNNSGAIIFTGTTTLAGANINATNFYDFKISGGSVTPTAVLTIQGSFTNDGTLNTGSGKVLFSGSTGGQTISGSTSTSFYDLELNKNNAGISLTVNSAQTVSHALILTNGQLDITNGALAMNAGTTITRSNLASISTSSPSGGPWNLVYVNNSMTSSFEIPSSGNLLSLTENMNSMANLALANDVTVSGTITINPQASGPTFTAGTHAVTTDALVNSGIFNSTTPGTMTLTGDFTSTGTFNGGSGTVLFNGVSNITGSNIHFNDFTINPGATVTFTGSPSLNIGGNYKNDGTLSAGTGTVVFDGISNKTLSGATQTQFYNLVLNKTNPGNSITFTTPQTVTNLLTLTDGTLNNTNNGLTMAPASAISVNFSGAIAGTITGVAPAGGAYDVIYTGNSNVNPGLEIQGLLRNVTNQNTAILTLNAPLVLSGVLTVSAGTVTSGSHTISTKDVDISAGTFNAPSTTLTMTGDFTDDATFNHNSGNVVFNGNSSVLGSATPLFNNITISGTLNGPTNLALAADFTNNGVFSSGAGKVSFNGGALQNIFGSVKTTFNNIDVNNATSPVSVSVERDTDLQGVLTLGAGAQFDADGSADASVFTILSLNDQPTQDGSIATIPGAAAVLGNVTAQRFVSAKDDDDRWFSSPISNATVAQLQDDFFVTGNFTGTQFPCTGCLTNKPSLNYYDETVTGVFAKGYKPTPVNLGTNAEVLVVGRGYDAWMWNGVAPFTVDLTGPINAGSITFPLVTHTTSVANADGWNLMGNPYPSAIQWNAAAGWTRPNIGTTVWLWDLRTSAWQFYDYNTNAHSAGMPNGSIAMGQAFWVVASATTTMMVDERVKTAAGGSYFRTAPNPFSGIRVSLKKDQRMDESIILFDNRATANFDDGMDAPKLQVGFEKLLIAPVDNEKRNHTVLAVNATYNEDIPLFIYAESEGAYEINFTQFNQFSGYGEYYLVDTYLRKQQSLSETGYKFSVTSNAQTKDNRFYLTRKPDALLSDNTRVQMNCYPNPTLDVVHIELNDEVESAALINGMGRPISEVPMIYSEGVSKGSINLGDLPAGLYFVKTMVRGNIMIGKVIKY